MKKLTLSAIALATLTLSSQAAAFGSLSDLKNAAKEKGAELQKSATDTQTAVNDSAQSVDMSDLVGLVSDNLGVSESQSKGGLASIFNYAKGNLSSSDYSQLASGIPGLSGIMDSLPSLSSDKQSGSGMSGLLNKASEYSSSIKGINELKQQFEALGLTPEMISSFVSQINTYLNNQDQDKTQSLLQQGLGNLLNKL